MKKINIYAISKKDEKCYEEILSEFILMSKRFAEIKIYNIFSKKINQAQSKNEELAKKSYSEALQPYLKDGFNIVLDPSAKEYDSIKFANILKEHEKINFFIGGAFGFEKDFVKKADLSISLSKLTMSHKIVKLVLGEQLYRAFTIIHHHPYHK